MWQSQNAMVYTRILSNYFPMRTARMIVRTAFECNRPALRLVQCRTDAHRPVVKTPDMQFLQQLAAEKKERISKPDERRLFAIYG